MTGAHRFRSDGLGLLQYPVGAADSNDVGDHIMGVVVIAWLSRFPIERWGTDWASGGTMRTRFRSHLTAGLELTTKVGGAPELMTLAVEGPDGKVFATAEASRDVVAAGARPFATAPRVVPSSTVAPTPDGLRDRVLSPLEFVFRADRDLAFTGSLDDGSFWRDRGWAHPAWVASSANAIVKRNVDFGEPGQWLHAGLDLTLHAPITDGSTVALNGRIERLFDRRRHRFAVAALEASVGDLTMATMRNTFAYAPLEPVTPE